MIDIYVWRNIDEQREMEDLHITLDKVKGSDGHVSKTAAEDSTSGTRGIECWRVHLDPLPRLAGRGNHEGFPLEHRGWSRSRRFRGWFRVWWCESSVRVSAEHLKQRQGSRWGRGVEEVGDERLPRGIHCCLARETEEEERQGREKWKCIGFAPCLPISRCQMRCQKAWGELRVNIGQNPRVIYTRLGWPINGSFFLINYENDTPPFP